MANDRKQAEAPFDRDRQANLRLRWAGRGMAEASFLYDAVAAELSERLSLVQRRFDTGLEIGGYDGRLARSASVQVETMIRMAPERRWLAETPLAVAGDDEWLPFRDDSLDLVLAPLTLHQTNDTPGAMAQIRRALRPDGLFLAALMGGENDSPDDAPFGQRFVDGGVHAGGRMKKFRETHPVSAPIITMIIPE